MKKKPKKTKNRPNYIVYLVLVFLLKVFSFFKGQKFEHKLKIKGPAITLSNHSSWFDFAYSINAIYPRVTRFVAAERMFLDKGSGFFLKISHAIPKKLYQADLKAAIEMLKELKNNGIISIFPEGQISVTGHSLEIGSSLARLIKKANVDVYMIKHKNACMVNPAWSKHTFKGRFYTDVKQIFRSTDLADIEENEITKIIRDELYFDPYEFNKDKKLKYKVSDIENLETVIYECPKCGSENLLNKKKSLYCKECSTDHKYDEYGYLGGHSIVDLYLKQSNNILKKYQKNPDFQLKNPVTLEGYQDGKVEKLGVGTISLSKNGYLYQGTYRDKDEELFFPISGVPSLPSDLGVNIQIYDEDQIYQFVFDKKNLPIKYVLFGEILFREIATPESLHGTFRIDGVAKKSAIF